MSENWIMAGYNPLIYSPSIHLFAFQQQTEFFSQSSSSLKSLSPEWSNRKYSQILNHFYVGQKIKSDYNNQDSIEQNYHSQVQKFLGTIKIQETLELIQGEAYPIKIDKSHIISLKLNRLGSDANQEINVTKLAYFNPKNCFSPQNINTNLGQTIIITALVNPRASSQLESLQSLAKSCLSAFAYLSDNSQRTVLIDSSIIDNGYVFTYYLPGQPRQYNQISVCLFFHQEDRENFQKYHQQLAKFLLSLHKLTYIHQHSSRLLKLASYHLGQLKYYLQTFSNNHITQVRFNKLETQYQTLSEDKGITHDWHKNNLADINKKPLAVLNRV